MKVAVIGSRSIRVKDLKKYLPENTTEREITWHKICYRFLQTE